MRILVTGAAGMLGSALVPALRQAGHTAIATDIDELDVTQTPNFQEFNIAAHYQKPVDLVIHLAAATDVDRCEEAARYAYVTNTIGTWNIAVECRTWQIPMVYVSTAGVFAGDKRGGNPQRYPAYATPSYLPYTPADLPNPVNVYGRTKLAGEYIVKDIAPAGSFTCRAGWMIGGGPTLDHKFVHHIMQQIRDIQHNEQPPVIYAVTDKIGTPTYARDFSEQLIKLIAEPQPCQLYHLVNSYAPKDGPPSRYDVAQAIVNITGRKIEVKPVSSEHFALSFPAPRADSEVLASSIPMRPWQTALEDYLLTEHWLEWITDGKC